MEKITLTPQEVANLLGVSRETIYTMTRENQIPHFRVRGRIMFNKEIIEAWTRGEYELGQAIG